MDLHQLKDDLQGFFKGEILFDEVARRLYSTDASIFQIKPAGVVVPLDEEDVCGLVRYAQEHGLALIPRGAGTGLAGEALGTGLVVDLSKHFRSIGEIGADTACVQPGVTCAALNARLREVGRRFAPDPASGDVCTIGGMVANNASGARAIRYGYTRDHVRSLRAVLDNGAAVSLPATPLPADADAHLRDIVTALGFLFDENHDLIAASRPRTPFDRLGYHLHGVRRGSAIDLPRLLVGSEGTLAFVTEATVATLPLPAGSCLALVAVTALEQAVELVQHLLPSSPSACEVMDRRLLSLARGSDASIVGQLVPTAAEAVVLIEYELDTTSDVVRHADELAERLRNHSAVIQAAVATESAELARLWRIREIALPSLYGKKGGAQPVAYVEDVAVPIAALREYLRRVQEILQEHETTASFLIHAGAGQVHTRPFLDLQKPDDVTRLWAISEKVHTLAIELGGTVSSQHGVGLARTPWVARQAGDLYPLYRQIKAIFDPKNIFNPGKVVDPEPGAARPLRHDPSVERQAIPLALHWDADALAVEANHCNGCGQCRTELAEQRMCPIFRATHNEAATPRAKANLLRHLLAERTEGMPLSSEEVREVADLCVNCRMCSMECPAHIDVPKLMLEAKAANVAEHGMDFSDWFFAHIETVLRLGSAVTFLANLALASRTTRWLLDKVFGVSQARRLPAFASRPFLTLARLRGLTRKPSGRRPTVVYFTDLYANYIEPQIAEATVAVLRHHGFDVYVPADQVGSGLEPLAHGDVESAREIARENLRVLGDTARTDWPIVCSEPGAALMLQHDYLHLQPDHDARSVAERTVELTAFLRQLHRQGRLRTDFQPLNLRISHHVPCHVKALGGMAAGPELLNLIPTLHTDTLDVSCSGMAGMFGLKSANYETSLRAGAPMLARFREPTHTHGSSECSTCRMQMEDVGKKRTLHPVQYLALAYGLMPQIAERLREPIRELVL